MLTLHLVEDYLNPNASRENRHVELLPGQTCADFVPNEWEVESCCAVVNGARVEMDYRLMEDDDILIYLAPEWEYLVQIAISFVVAWLLAPDIPNNKPDGPGRRTYGFTGVGNRWGQSTTVPVLFGSMQVGGHVIGYYNEATGASTGQHINLMLALSEGPVHEIAGETISNGQPQDPNVGGLFLDSNDAQKYSGVTFTNSMGSDNGDAFAGFLSSHIQRSVGQEIGIRDARLAVAYTGGDASVVVDDNSIFFAGDTVFIGHNGPTAEGNSEVVDTGGVDADGITLHLVTPTSGSSASVGARVVAYSPVTITGDGTTGKALKFNLHFPQGLYRMNSNGQAVNYHAIAHVRVRTHSGPGAWTVLGDINFTNNRIGGYWETVVMSLVGTVFEDTDIDIEIEKVTGGVTGSSPTYADQMDLHSVVFQDEGLYKHPGTATVAIHGVPTAQLNGRFPTLTAQVEGKTFDIPDDDLGSSWTAASALAGSVEYRNPAWIALDILRNTRYGLGGFVADEDIDIASFREWGEFCEEDTLSGFAQTHLVDDSGIGASSIRVPIGAGSAFAVGDKIVIGYNLDTVETVTLDIITPGTPGNGVGVTPFEEDFDLLQFTGTSLINGHAYGEIAGATEKRCLCDFYFDEDSTVSEALSVVAGAGRAIIVKTGNKYRAVIDRERDPVQLIDEANIIKDSFSRTVVGKVDLPNTLDVVFFNRETSYNRASARVVDGEALAAGEVQKIERIEAKGVTRIGQAYRDAAYMLRKRRRENERIQFDVGLDGLAAEAGDRVDVAHYSMSNGKGSKVIDAQVFNGKTQIKLDDDVDYSLFPNDQWQVKIAIDTDDTIEAEYMHGGGPRGVWITLGDDIGSTVLIGMHCAYGPAGRVVEPYVIQEIGRTEQLERRVLAVRYDATIYEDIAPEPLPEDNGWETETRPGGSEIGEQGWDDWAANTGGAGGYGEPDSNLAALVHTGDAPDGTKWQKILLSWNAPTVDPPLGSDAFSETFRTAGTWDAGTRTLADDSALSDKATEGGGRRWGGDLIRGYEIFVRDPLGDGLATAWRWVATTEETGVLIGEQFEEGSTYEFAVVPVTAKGFKLPIAECPQIDVLIPTDTGGPGYIHIDAEPTTLEMQEGTSTDVTGMSPALSRAGWLIKEAGAPTTAPPSSGMVHYDSTTGDLRVADGTASVDDWRLMFIADKGTRDFRLDDDEKLVWGDGPTSRIEVSYSSSTGAAFTTPSDFKISCADFTIEDQALASKHLVCDETSREVWLYGSGVKVATAHVGGLTIAGDIGVTGTVDGRDVATDGAKLDTIDTDAEANDVDSVNGQTGAVSLDADDIANGSGSFFMTLAHKTMADNIDSISNDRFVGNVSGVGGAPSAMTQAEALTLLGLNNAIQNRVFGVLQTNGTGSPTLEANSYNLASVSRTSIGKYTFTFSGGLGLTANAYTASVGPCISTSAQFFVAKILTRTASVVTFEVRNASTLALADGGDWPLTIKANI